MYQGCMFYICSINGTSRRIIFLLMAPVEKNSFSINGTRREEFFSNVVTVTRVRYRNYI
jgi:hypothetical protein